MRRGGKGGAKLYNIILSQNFFIVFCKDENNYITLQFKSE
jgi:hypothetical protein